MNETPTVNQILPPSPATPQPKKRKKLAIILIVVGAVVVLALAAGLTWWLLSRQGGDVKFTDAKKSSDNQTVAKDDENTDKTDTDETDDNATQDYCRSTIRRKITDADTPYINACNKCRANAQSTWDANEGECVDSNGGRTDYLGRTVDPTIIDNANGRISGDPVPTSDELLRAYAAAGNDITNMCVNIDYAQVLNSPIAPYQTVAVAMGGCEGGGFGAIFYRNGKNDTWKFAFGTQGGVGCDQKDDKSGKYFDHMDIRKALYDEACYADDSYTGVVADNLGQTTVGLYYNMKP